MALFRDLPPATQGTSGQVAGGERAVLDAQDTGCGHHLGSPPPAFVCRVVAASALA
jgi:hypothetical protein